MVEISLQPTFIFSFPGSVCPGDHLGRPHQVGHRPLSSRAGRLALDEAQAGHSGWYLENRMLDSGLLSVIKLFISIRAMKSGSSPQSQSIPSSTSLT